MRHFHRFAYSAAMRDGEEPSPFKIRDGAAFSELTAPLVELGFRYGQLIYNPPFHPEKRPRLGAEFFRFIKPNDLIVLATRPPIDDLTHGDKKRMLKSCTHLEEKIFTECKNYLAICARSHIQLSESVAANFDRADLDFQQHKGARLRSYRPLTGNKRTRIPKGTDLSIGFFLHTKSIPEYGCGLVVSFGMGGWETLVWNRMIRTRFSDWLRKPIFVVAEMAIGNFPQKSATLDFVDQIKPNILVKHSIR
ncbi:MAG: hypothetical protein PCFJNLEI_02368 [Verrucomicrobiae bacterium]|nr:hypothetical protein [Verrucomicrobiae bacterium]